MSRADELRGIALEMSDAADSADADGVTIRGFAERLEAIADRTPVSESIANIAGYAIALDRMAMCNSRTADGANLSQSAQLIRDYAALLTRTEAAPVADGAVGEVVDLQASFPACAVVPAFPVGTKLYTHPQDASAITGRVNGYMFSARAIEIITDGEIPEWLSKSPGLRVTVAAMSAKDGSNG